MYISLFLKNKDTLKEHAAPGPDGITYKIIKLFSPEMKNQLLKIFNQPYETGDFYQSWKVAEINRDPVKRPVT
jgi:hypothetical protein